MSEIREKESLECVRMHIWSSKTQKLPGPLSRPWTPATECSLRSCDSTSLRRQLSASEAGAPPLTKSWIRTWLHTAYIPGWKLCTIFARWCRVSWEGGVCISLGYTLILGTLFSGFCCLTRGCLWLRYTQIQLQPMGVYPFLSDSTV